MVLPSKTNVFNEEQCFCLVKLIFPILQCETSFAMFLFSETIVLPNKTNISIYFRGLGWKTWWKLGETSETYGLLSFTVCFLLFEGFLKFFIKSMVWVSKTNIFNKN